MSHPLVGSLFATAVFADPDYGVLKNVVAAAGSLLAATGALLLGWRGRGRWEPAEEDVPRGPQKVGSLLAALAIAVIWARYRHDHPQTLTGLIIGFGVACLIALCAYSFLIGVYTYKDVGNNRVVIGG